LNSALQNGDNVDAISRVIQKWIEK